MKKLVADHKGFTLVELMITVVIVGILASVAIPLYQANVKRAKAAEADAILGTIRTALRVYYAENGSYPTATDVYPWNVSGLEIDSADVIGKYFPATAFKLTSSSTSYTIKATGTGSSSGVNRKITTDGTLADF